MSELQNKFDQLISEQKALQQKFQETAQSLFKETMKEFWDKNPGVTAVVWTQYQQFWNDGEECCFQVYDPVFTNATNDELYNVNPYGEYVGDDESVWATENISHVLSSDRDWHVDTKNKIIATGGIDAESCSLLSKMICSNELQDVMLAMFGNHVKIIADRNGFDVDEFDHD